MNTETNNSVLIVDDDKANLLELIHILRPEYKLYSAKDGVSALKLARENKPDLILLDIVLPGLSGYEVLAKLKESDNTNDIPVIFITGISETEDENTGLSLGAADYIRKPFARLVVLRRVRHQIEIVNLRRELLAAKNMEK
ncbi:MAG: response regulator [Treponema sp.]|nr:response regulator [Treponema sp.]